MHFSINKVVKEQNISNFEKVEWIGEQKLIWEREDVRTTIDPNKVDTVVWEFEICAMEFEMKGRVS